MLGRLETAFQRERLFIAEASHELRTPLSLLRTELDLALRRPRSREDLEAAIRSAAEETDRLISLATDLLLIARSEEQTITVHPETVSTHDLLSTVAERFSARARIDGREVSVVPGGDVEFEADRKRVEQALANLLDNALLHGGGGVTLAARRAGDRVELHVTDQGPGFPPDFAPRAFDRFSRADEARRRSGSGLGLAIVQAIAVAHEGSANATNSQPRGADVWISLPAQAAAAASKRGQPSGRHRRARPPNPPANTRLTRPERRDETGSGDGIA
jgi:signal transduction histidine kinase